MKQLELRLFGSFGASLDSVPITQFRTDKMRALLAYLAMNDARPFRRDILATLLWSDWSDQAARRNLRQSLHRIVQLLDKVAEPLGTELFTADRQTVQLNQSVVQVDVRHFRRHLEKIEAHSHNNIHTCDHCLTEMQQAAALYRGNLLEGFVVDAYPFEEWLFVERERLQQQVLELFDKLSSAFEWQGDYSKAQYYAHQQIAIAPWRESAHRRLMRLLKYQGKRSDALAQYETCRHLLAEELGVEPAPETVKLWQQIKDDSLEKPAAPVEPSASFPTQLTPFIGRQSDISEILERMADENCRLLTLIGPGGIGKTRLSIQVGQKLSANADRYTDGAYFMPLVSVSDVSTLVNVITQNLGINLSGPTPPREQLLSYLADKVMLLVFDNFEQVVQGPAFVAQIVSQAPGVQLLITSRQPLELQMEWRQIVNGLDFHQGKESEAVLFFQRNAKRVAPTFQLDEANLPAVLELCQLVDGMPLALEIAAAWTRMMDTPTILRETRRSLDFLTAPMDDFPDRHRSVQAVMGQSWQMLTGHLQVILGQMALFGAEFTLEAALAIIEKASMLDIATLLDKSLLKWQSNGRYQMHELLRQFVRAQDYEEPAEFRNKYSQFYLGLVIKHGEKLFGSNPPKAITAIQTEMGHIRLAWRWAISAGMESLLENALEGLLNYYEFSGMYYEGRELFKAAAETLPSSSLVNRLRLAEASCLRRLGDLDGAAALANGVIATEWTDTRLTAMIALAKINEQGSDYDKAISILQVALEMAEPMSQEAAQIWTILGTIYGYLGPMEKRIAAHKKALAINVALEDRLQTAECYNLLGTIYKDLGEYEEAIDHTKQALAIAEEMNHRESISRFMHRIGVIYWRQENMTEAQAWYEQALAIATEINHKRLITIISGSLGIQAKRRREYDEALRYYWRVVNLAKQLGDRSIEAVFLGNIGNAYMDLGQYDRALEHLMKAAKIDESLGATGGVARHHGNMGDALKFQNRYEEAIPHFEAAIGPLRQNGTLFFLCWVLVSYGECLFEVGRLEEARTANNEGKKVAEEVGRDFYLMMSLLLDARLDLVDGGDKEEIGERVAKLHERFQASFEMTVEIDFVLWKITGDSTVRDRVESEFKQLYEETKRERYRTWMMDVSSE